MRLVSWVMTAGTVAFITLCITTRVPETAVVSVGVEFVMVTAWLHFITWAFPYLCAMGASRDRSSVEGP